MTKSVDEMRSSMAVLKHLKQEVEGHVEHFKQRIIDVQVECVEQLNVLPEQMTLEQCDLMTRLCYQYLAIYEKFAQKHINFAKVSQKPNKP